MWDFIDIIGYDQGCGVGVGSRSRESEAFLRESESESESVKRIPTPDSLCSTKCGCLADINCCLTMNADSETFLPSTIYILANNCNGI